ncbi:hypothetical protein CEXT_505151 [Caerostris extrusa]|uniref:Uncharacterized protein n=1 Tax=Caerostris extrusa TaxID=172846 RepID=A0AAV4WFL5_CAEEX|nr:hypothetical protein CEXT_505151 [Caerostris extrusa]
MQFYFISVPTVCSGDYYDSNKFRHTEHGEIPEELYSERGNQLLLFEPEAKCEAVGYQKEVCEKMNRIEETAPMPKGIYSVPNLFTSPLQFKVIAVTVAPWLCKKFGSCVLATVVIK